MSDEIFKISDFDEFIKAYKNIPPDDKHGVFTWAEIEKNTKEELEEYGSYIPTIYLNSKKGRIEILLQFENDFKKEYTKIKLREMIHTLNIDRYWIAATAWWAESSDVRPSENPNRKETLIIEEYTMGSSKTKFLFFSRQGKKIVWENEVNFPADNGDDVTSSWNFFKEDITKELYNNKNRGRNLYE